MQTPLVTVIVPAYNCEKYIEKCVKSVLNQSYEKIEVIVINDGSKDGTLEKLNELQKTDARLIVRDQENQGVSCTRNRGVKLATGKYITFIDGDDYVGKEYIRSFVDAAEKNQAELCVSGYRMIDEKGKELTRVLPKGEYIRFQHEEFAYRILATCGRFYRLDLWKKYSIKYVEDKQIRGEDIPIALLTNALAKNIRYVRMAEYYYIQHSDSARNNMRGLAKFKLPYQRIENDIAFVMNMENANGKDFFEMGIFRIFVTFLFDLGLGAKKEILCEMIHFELKIINKYFGQYKVNQKMYLSSGLDIPLRQKAAVKMYIVLLNIANTFRIIKFAEKRSDTEER